MHTAIEKIWVSAEDELNPTGVAGLRQRLVTMGTVAQKLVNEALHALIQRDSELALYVNQNDRLLDYCAIEIDNLAIRQLANGPLARDFRSVTVVMKMSHHLERIGDEASKIARQASALCLDPPLIGDLDIQAMAIISIGMLEKALIAFSQRDNVAALKLIPLDKEVDALNKTIRQKLVECMVANPQQTRCCLRWMVVAKSLERIADHATNIAEDVVFLCEGRNIKHTKLKYGVLSPLACN